LRHCTAAVADTYCDASEAGENGGTATSTLYPGVEWTTDREARGCIENKHSTDAESPPSPPRVCLYARGVIENMHSADDEATKQVRASVSAIDPEDMTQ
jgi:hypothetical protein